MVGAVALVDAEGEVEDGGCEGDASELGLGVSGFHWVTGRVHYVRSPL